MQNTLRMEYKARGQDEGACPHHYKPGSSIL